MAASIRAAITSGNAPESSIFNLGILNPEKTQYFKDKFPVRFAIHDVDFAFKYQFDTAFISQFECDKTVGSDRFAFVSGSCHRSHNSAVLVIFNLPKVEKKDEKAMGNQYIGVWGLGIRDLGLGI